MSRFSLICGFAIGVLVNAVAMAETVSEEPKVIPLDQIWGYDLPGTRDVRELEPKADIKLLGTELDGLSRDEAARRMMDEFTRRLDVWKILKVLKRRPAEGEAAGPAFVVTGKGKEALQNAEAVFSGKEDALRVIPTDTDVSLVFYSYLCGRHIHLVSADRLQQQITVKYRFVAHGKDMMSTRFALIPIGKLTEGTYDVVIEQVEAIDERGRLVAGIGDAQRLVSDSFSFVVQRE